MVLNLIKLWQFKAANSEGLAFDADEDLNHMTFDIMEAAAFGTPPSKSSLVLHLAKLQETDLSGRGRSELMDFPRHEEAGGLLHAIHTLEDYAGRMVGYPGIRIYQILTNNLNPRIRKAFKARDSTSR